MSLHVILLGSAPLSIQTGLSESLAGRFEVIPITHWSYSEMHDAFGWNINQYICYGGYPGSADLLIKSTEDNFKRWRHYIMESLIETTVSRDILQMTRIDVADGIHIKESFSFFLCSFNKSIKHWSRLHGS